MCPEVQRLIGGIKQAEDALPGGGLGVAVSRHDEVFVEVLWHVILVVQRSCQPTAGEGCGWEHGGLVMLRSLSGDDGSPGWCSFLSGSRPGTTSEIHVVSKSIQKLMDADHTLKRQIVDVQTNGHGCMQAEREDSYIYQENTRHSDSALPTCTKNSSSSSTPQLSGEQLMLKH